MRAFFCSELRIQLSVPEILVHSVIEELLFFDGGNFGGKRPQTKTNM